MRTPDPMHQHQRRAVAEHAHGNNLAIAGREAVVISGRGSAKAHESEIAQRVKSASQAPSGVLAVQEVQAEHCRTWRRFSPTMHSRAAPAQIACLIGKRLGGRRRAQLSHPNATMRTSTVITPARTRISTPAFRLSLRDRHGKREMLVRHRHSTPPAVLLQSVSNRFSLCHQSLAPLAPTLDRRWHGPCNKSFEQMLNLCEPKSRSSQLNGSYRHSLKD